MATHVRGRVDKIFDLWAWEEAIHRSKLRKGWDEGEIYSDK